MLTISFYVVLNMLSIVIYDNCSAVGGFIMVGERGERGLGKNGGYHGWPTTKNFKTTLAKIP